MGQFQKELKERANILMNGEGNQEYDYGMIFTDDFHGTNVYTGTIRANNPREAAYNVVRKHTDLVDDWYRDRPDFLEPVFTVARNTDGTFTADIETHGLGEVGVSLTRIS